jgi:signal transduction histidine kinase
LSPATEEAERDALRRAAIVGQLTSGILHDFNNVLTVITGMIDLLAQAVADEPQLAGAARLIDEAATRGATLASHPVAFARGQPAQPREVDVAVLLDKAGRVLRPTLSGIEIAVAVPADLPPALADPGQLMAAILSLAITARNAMPEGGKIVLGARATPIMDRLAHARAIHPDGLSGDLLAISVDAHGYGEVARHRESIFIDVGIARDFITPSGGQLDLRASADESARAEILLPKARANARWLAES